jgi:hypothetical protein
MKLEFEFTIINNKKNGIMKEHTNRKLTILLLFFVLVSQVLACNKASPAVSPDKFQTWLVHGSGAPDDIVLNVFELNYRANLEQGGINPPPLIPSEQVVLKSGTKKIYLSYRKTITSKAGEFRNNLFVVTRGYPDDNFNGSIKLKVVAPQSNIKFTEGEGTGHMLTSYTVLVIEIPDTVKPGRYEYSIGIEFDSMDFGVLPGIIEVVE